MNYNTVGFFNGQSNVDYSDNFHHWYNHLENYENGDVEESSKLVMAADEGVEPEEDNFYDSWSNRERYNEAERHNEDGRIRAGEKWEEGCTKDPFGDWDKHYFYGSRGDDFVGVADFEAPTSTTGFDYENVHRGGGRGRSANRGKRRRARTLSDEQRHPCRVCGKMLSTKWYAREHERSVHGTGDSYQCNICGERLKLAIYAVKHVQKEHPTCTEKPFGQYYKLVSDPIDSVFTCNLCGVETMQMCEIQRHLKELHNIDKRFNRHYSKKEKGGSKEYRGWSGRRLTRGRGRGRGRQRLRGGADRFGTNIPEPLAIMNHQMKLSPPNMDHQMMLTEPPSLHQPLSPPLHLALSPTQRTPPSVYGHRTSMESNMRADDGVNNDDDGVIHPYPSIPGAPRLDPTQLNHRLMSNGASIQAEQSQGHNEKHSLPPPYPQTHQHNGRIGSIHDLIPFVDISNPVAAESMPYHAKPSHHSSIKDGFSHSQPLRQDVEAPHTNHHHHHPRVSLGPHHLDHSLPRHISPPSILIPSNSLSNHRQPLSQPTPDQPQPLSPPAQETPHATSHTHPRSQPTASNHRPASPHSTNILNPLCSHPIHPLLPSAPGHLIPPNIGETQRRTTSQGSYSPESVTINRSYREHSPHSTFHADPTGIPSSTFPLPHATHASRARPHLPTQGPSTSASSLAGITKISDVVPTFDTDLPFNRTSHTNKGVAMDPAVAATSPASNQSSALAVRGVPELRHRSLDAIRPPHRDYHPYVMPSTSPLFKTENSDESTKHNEFLGNHFDDSTILRPNDLVGSSSSTSTGSDSHQHHHLCFPNSPSSNINSNLKSFLETSDQF